jgi:rfaE bifunctional protein kinase chain/domain
MMDFDQLFKRFSNSKVLVVGDIMLDTYWWGNVDRISPEAPVPVVTLKDKEFRVGGAANVALNTASLEADTTVIAVIGDDENGTRLKQLLDTYKINTSYLVTDNDRVTTSKTRVMSRNQQMMRLDAESTDDIGKEIEDRLLRNVEAFFQKHKPDVLILEDYNKGVLTKRVIKELIALCRTNDVITAVDPKRKNFFSFQGVDIFKPNLKEVKEGMNLLVDAVDRDTLKEIHHSLQKQLEHKVSLITLSEKGVFYQLDNDARIIPTHVRNIADVSGAGDTVIAVAALVYAVTKNMHLAADMANIAGGLVCEEVGTAAIDKEKLYNECSLLLD